MPKYRAGICWWLRTLGLPVPWWLEMLMFDGRVPARMVQRRVTRGKRRAVDQGAGLLGELLESLFK